MELSKETWILLIAWVISILLSNRIFSVLLFAGVSYFIIRQENGKAEDLHKVKKFWNRPDGLEELDNQGHVINTVQEKPAAPTQPTPQNDEDVLKQLTEEMEHETNNRI